MNSNFRRFASKLSGNWIISVFLILSAILFYSRIVKSESIKLKLLPSKQGICNNKTLPEGLSHLDPVLNKIVTCTDKYLGVQTFNEIGNQGFQLYDKELNLLWDKKPRSFEEEKKEKTSYDEHLVFSGVAISDNAKIVILKLGNKGRRSHTGIEIYIKTLFGYKKTKKIDIGSSHCLVEIDEENERIYTAGFFPDFSNKDLKVACFTTKGNLVWSKTVPHATQDKGMKVSSDFTIQFYYGLIQPFIGEGSIIINSSGKVLGNTKDQGSCAMDLSRDGSIALFASERKIQIYETRPYSKRLSFELECNPNWEIFFIKDVAISPDNEMIAVLCQVKNSTASESRIVVFDKTGIKLAEKSTLDWGVNPQEVTFENDKMIGLDRTWKVSLEN